MKYRAVVQSTADLPWDDDARLVWTVGEVHVTETHRFSRDFQADSLFKLMFLVEEFVTNSKCWDIIMTLTDNTGVENFSRASWMHGWTEGVSHEKSYC